MIMTKRCIAFGLLSNAQQRTSLSVRFSLFLVLVVVSLFLLSLWLDLVLRELKNPNVKKKSSTLTSLPVP